MTAGMLLNTSSAAAPGVAATASGFEEALETFFENYFGG